MAEPKAPRRADFRPVAARLRRWTRLSSRKSASGKAVTPRRIVLWALVIGCIAGFFNLPLPIEDPMRAGRAALRMHAADQSTVVVLVDDYTLSELAVSDPRRSDDAKVLDNLFEMGAQRVFFDRAYADTTVPAEDGQLVKAFQRHSPHVFVGLLADVMAGDGKTISIKPNPLFEPHVNVVSITGDEGPLGLSTRFPGSSVVDGKRYPSLSAELAGAKPFDGFYRVDFAIDHASIPRVNYIDVLRNRVPRSAIAGRDVVIAPSSHFNADFHPVPFRNPAPGAVLHVVGAETLKNGQPRDYGWLPALAVVALVIALQARRQRPSRRVFGLTAVALLATPMALEISNITIDIVPALIAHVIAWVRLHRLASTTYRGATGLKRIETLYGTGMAPTADVFALKIRNFATISANLTMEEIDQLLTKAQGMLRATDSAADFAFDKDTFVWLRPKSGIEEIEEHVRGLHALFRTSITLGAHAPDVATSIGVDTIGDAPLRSRIENAIQCTEDAAHANRIFMISEAALAADRAWRLQILSELEKAIAADEVEVVFQPKVSLVDERIVGAEALMRWHHPVRGPIDPSLVISCAEEHNRVDMITRFVLMRAMRDANRAIAADPGFKVAVNISALDLSEPGFVGTVQSLIAANRFPVANLVLEITETAPIESNKIVATNLAALKKMGVDLSVDDFGIGHASLHYLRQIPAGEVKIDRSFVAGMATSGEDRALVRTAIDMIHSLGRIATAEGVESAATVTMLREMGCDVAQGYFFYRPITMETLVPRLGRGAKAA